MCNEGVSGSVAKNFKLIKADSAGGRDRAPACCAGDSYSPAEDGLPRHTPRPRCSPATDPASPPGPHSAPGRGITCFTLVGRSLRARLSPAPSAGREPEGAPGRGVSGVGLWEIGSAATGRRRKHMNQHDRRRPGRRAARPAALRHAGMAQR